MEQYIGISRTGNLDEAVRGLQNPGFIMMIVSDKSIFADRVRQMEQKFPGVPCIGCVGQSYGGTEVIENGIMVSAFTGQVRAVADVFTEVSKAPVYRIRQFQKNVSSIQPGHEDTVLIDFCSGNDECVLTTMHSVLGDKKIPVTGGTAWEGLVSCNGIVYEDACAYAIVKNQSGKIKVYKENIYSKTEMKHIVTKADPSTYKICELDGKPAGAVYREELGISRDKVAKQTFANPLGRCIGDEVYIISIKEDEPDDSLVCFRKTNPKDVITILKGADHEAILNQTIASMKQDFSHISGIFSVNCIFRYYYFQQINFVDEYFKKMASLGSHAGMIGQGEHFNSQHTNQTMTCVVFE